MENVEALARLEQYIENLLTNCRELRGENKILSDKLMRRERELADLNEKNAALQDNKKVVYNRVSGLIEKLEEWEKEKGVRPDNVQPFIPEGSTGRPHGPETPPLFSITGE